MTGNVLEWTSELHSLNYNSPRNRPWHCLRGGSFHSNLLNSRCTQRDHEGGIFEGRGKDVGLRLVL